MLGSADYELLAIIKSQPFVSAEPDIVQRIDDNAVDPVAGQAVTVIIGYPVLFSIELGHTLIGADPLEPEPVDGNGPHRIADEAVRGGVVLPLLGVGQFEQEWFVWRWCGVC